MDYYDSDLNKILRSKTEFSENDIRYFLINILLGVHHLHSANVLHRDLKPHNILVNSEMSVKICDFGLSRGVNDMDPIGGILTDTTPTVQTQWYKSPEQLLCFAKGRREMDVWSAGCIFAELLKPKGKFNFFTFRKTHPHVPWKVELGLFSNFVDCKNIRKTENSRDKRVSGRN